MFTYPVQRQMLPWIALRISSSLGRGLRSRSQLARLDLALVGDAVHVDGDRAHDLGRHDARSFAARTARTASTSARWRRYSAGAWTSSGGWRPAARTAPRTASSSADSGRTRTGTASTQPTTTRGAPPSRLAATFTMHVPSRPIGSDAKPSALPAGLVTVVSSSPGPAAVM